MRVLLLWPIFVLATDPSNDFCQIEENLVITLQCTDECIVEMKDCLVECDVGDQDCQLDCHWDQVGFFVE